MSKAKVNVLLTITSYPPSTGGAQSLMHELAKRLHQHHPVQVISLWDTNRTDWLLGTTLNAPRESIAYCADDIPVQRVAISPRVRQNLAPWVLSYYLLETQAIQHIAAALADEMRPHTAAADLIHNCRVGREPFSFASLQLARERAIPFVFTPLHHPRWGSWLHRHYHRLYRQADAVIALTEAERQTCVHLGVDERKVFVTGMGPILADQANASRFREQYALGDDPIVLFLGQKFAYKGVAALLQAANLVWRHRPDVRFAFVGPRTGYSQRLFRDVTEQRILEVGTVDLQTKTDALAACDVLCVPSTQESFGGVLTEAWSLGKPVIAGDNPAAREVVDEGIDGLITQPQAGEIAERLMQLLDDPAARERLGRCGRDKVARRFTWPRLAEQTEAIYARVLNGSA